MPNKKIIISVFALSVVSLSVWLLLNPSSNSLPEKDIDQETLHCYFYDYNKNAPQSTLTKGKGLNTPFDIHQSIQDFNRLSKSKLRWVDTDSASQTITLSVDSAHFISEQSGSYGAMEWLTQVVYTFTVDPLFDKVHLTFEEGSHLSPGTYTRNDLSVFIKENNLYIEIEY